MWTTIRRKRLKKPKIFELGIDDRTFEFTIQERANDEWRKNQNDQRIIRRALLLVRAGEYLQLSPL